MNVFNNYIKTRTWRKRHPQTKTKPKLQTKQQGSSEQSGVTGGGQFKMFNII